MSEKSLPRIRVWDLPTRIFHWLLALLIFCSWASYEFSDKFGDNTLLWHRMNGYAIAVLVLWRLLWGLVGSPASRFANFFYWPWSAARYGGDLVSGRERHFLGHNPLGSYMVFALLAVVGAQASLGLVSTEHNSTTWGPLALLLSDERSAWFTKIHEWLFESILLLLIAAHIAANVLYRVIKKDPLIEAMVTGSKPAGDYEDLKAVTDGGTERGTGMVLLRAAVCLAIAMAIFAGVIKGLGGKLFY